MTPTLPFRETDAPMARAYEGAQKTFRYFWRELSWERRRIVPGLDNAVTKLPFTDDPNSRDASRYEFMWVSDVDFDGTHLTGTLLNQPRFLQNWAEGDSVEAPFGHLLDWMFAAEGEAFGGYTISLVRARMSPKQREMHDDAWGLDFGEPGEIRLEMGGRGPGNRLLARRTHPDRFEDHVMCVNMLPKIEAQLKEDRTIATTVDERGWSILHTEAMAGNFGVVRLLVQYGADPRAKNPEGLEAAEVARRIGWKEIAEYLSGATQKER